ncbi:exopolysaccharide production repressor protein [Mesorhizobium sp. B2-3-5]|uniref:exopolysaccharide production repressor protein n=1 Tax=unclassified Mesorhizobium TaxID=325217 RepID=UPI0032B1052C
MKRWARVSGIRAGESAELGRSAICASMYVGRFLVGMSATTIIVAVWAYMATGSFWKALTWTVVTLVVLQVGYFVLVVGLIHRRAQDAATSQDSIDAVPPLHRDGVSF